MVERFNKGITGSGPSRVPMRSEMQIGDPAVVASIELQRAEEALLGLPSQSVEDEMNKNFIAAEARWEKAELEFADAVPTTSAGVLAKLQALNDLLTESDEAQNSIERRHVLALIAYFKRMS